jgi:uncharacterized protein (TIGR02246 family)
LLIGLLLALGLITGRPAAGSAAGLAAPPPGDGRSTRCAPIDAAQVEALFDRWNRALASADPDAVVALYSPDALLLPTLSPEARRSPARIRDYFVDFLARSPRGRIDSRSIQLGCNSAVDAGTYSFLVTDPAAPTLAPHWVSARYTFVYTLSDGRWLIQHHHSSLQPPAS